MFCSYCGANIIMENDNEHIYRHIDEAEVKKAETEQIVQIKKMEMAEKRRKSAEKTKKLKIKYALIFVVAGSIMSLIGSKTSEVCSWIGIALFFGAAYIGLSLLNPSNGSQGNSFEDIAPVPSGIKDYKKKSYVVVEAAFKGAGFTNVTSIPLNDLPKLKRIANRVTTVLINGNEISYEGEKFPLDAKVDIYYHSVFNR